MEQNEWPTEWWLHLWFAKIPSGNSTRYFAKKLYNNLDFRIYVRSFVCLPDISSLWEKKEIKTHVVFIHILCVTAQMGLSERGSVCACEYIYPFISFHFKHLICLFNLIHRQWNHRFNHAREWYLFRKRAANNRWFRLGRWINIEVN